MGHQHLSTQSDTGRATTKLIATLLGGMLVLASFVAGWLLDPTDERGKGFYSQSLALLGTLFLAVPLWWHSLKSLISGNLHMDEIVALAILAAVAGGMYQTAGVVAFFLLLSILIETRTALGARTAIEGLMRLTPTKARRLDEQGREVEVEAHNLRAGDLVLVLPGDNVPADGTIVDGNSTINEANITGESLPAEKSGGDEVYGGTTNVTGALKIRVTKVGADTTLGRVQDLILEAEHTKLPIMRMIDQYAGWYTPIVLMITALVWFLSEYNTAKAIAMLVIACPCELIVATPAAIVASLSAAARLGVYIKDVTNLEVARRITAVVLDKTGTLTTGQLSVSRLVPAPGVDAAELLQIAASVEQNSRHPVARAVVATARRARVPLSATTGFEEVSAKGVQAHLGSEQIRIGRRIWVEQMGADLSLLSGPEFIEPEGLSTLYVVRDGRCIGWIGLEDRTRPEAQQALEDLRELGIRDLIMVTGDRWSVARRVAAEMGCSDVQAEVLPQDKLAIVDALKKRGHRVAVVGDGVNDAPALAAGHLGIAMGAAGSDVALNSASVALMSSDLRKLPFLIGLSRAMTNVIWQNLIFGISFIIVMEIIIVFGDLSPMLAALLHTVASAIVIFNSARMVRYGEHLEWEGPGKTVETDEPGAGQGHVALQPVAG